MKTKKITIAVPKSRPRNPFHETIKNLRAGVHGPSRKAVRQQQRQNLLRHISDLIDGDKTEFEID